MVAETAATPSPSSPATPRWSSCARTSSAPPPDMRSADGSVTIRYRRRMIDQEPRGARGPQSVLPWSVEIDGLTDLDADLRECPSPGLRCAAVSTTWRCACRGRTGPCACRSRAARATASRPAGVPVAIAARGGVSRLRFDDQRVDASGSDLALSSAGFSTTPDRYELDLQGGVSDLDVREE